MHYFVKTPWWLKKLYRGLVWDYKTSQKKIYLTFDDGPHPIITSGVLDELSKYNAKATFFCIGKNVKEHPEIYQRILLEGHAIGNHTFDHLNGWKTADDVYINNVNEAKSYIDSVFFRPPYGKIKRSQLKKIRKEDASIHFIMWTVLSGDFDKDISKEKCLDNVIKNSVNGSVIVFHDSEKAFEKMSYSLPLVLKYFSEKGYVFEKIPSI